MTQFKKLLLGLIGALGLFFFAFLAYAVTPQNQGVGGTATSTKFTTGSLIYQNANGYAGEIPIAGSNVTINTSTPGQITFSSSGSGSYNVISANGLISVATTTSLATLTASTSPTFTNGAFTGTLIVTGSTTLGSLTAGCVNSTSGGSLFTAACASGGSGNSTFTIGNGVIYNATSTDSVLVGTSTPTTSQFFIQGSGIKNPLSVASSSGTSYLTVLANGNIGIGTNAPTRTLDIVGVKSAAATNVLNIQGDTGIAGSTSGQAVSITSGNGKQWTSSSQTVGGGGNLSFNTGAGGDLNDNTITGTQTAGTGGAFNVFVGSGGNLDDTPNSSAVTLTAGLGAGFSLQSGSGGDASLGDLTNTTGGAGGGFQLIAQGGGASQSQRIGIGGKGGSMALSLFSGGSVVALSGATNATGGNTGSFTISIGVGGSVTRSGSQNASAISTGGNSGAYTITFGAGGSAAVSGASATSTGGNAGNGSFVGANGGNATGFSGAKSFGGNGTSYSFQTGKGGTGSTANGIDGNTSFIDGYGNTIMTILGNNTQKIGINSTTPNAALVVQGTSTQPTLPVLIISSSTGTSLFQVNANGKVGIATTTPGYGFVNVGTAQFAGLATASSGLSGYACFDAANQLVDDSALCITVSAARFKTNIDPLENIINPLAETMAMQAVHYDLKPDAPGYVPGIQYGLIADDIKTIDSNLVVNEVATTTFEGKVYPPGTVEGLAQPNSWIGLFVADIQAQQKEIQDITVKKVKDAQDNWQWIAIGLLTLGFIFQQIQINKLKK